jgi:hypothetical protein
MKLNQNNYVYKIFLTFFVLFSYFVQWVWWTSNTNLDLIQAIVDENRFEINSFANNTGDRSFYKGNYYSDKFPGLSFLTLHIYSFLKFLSSSLFFSEINKNINFTSHIYTSQYGSTVLVNDLYPNIFTSIMHVFLTTLSSSLFTALSVITIYKLLKYFTKNEKLIILTILSYAIGTLAWHYATVFYSHATQSFLLIFSFLLVYRYLSTKSKRFLFLSGLLSGFSLTFSITSAITTLFYFYVAIKIKNIIKPLLFIIAFVLGTLPLFVYNYVIFSNPLNFSYLNMDPVIWPHLVGRSGFNFPPSPYIFYRLLLDPYRGLLFYHPIILFSFVGITFMFRKYLWESLLILSVFLFFLVINASWWAWEGGTSFGARHLLPTVPFLMIPLIFSLQKIPLTILKPFIIVSIFFSILGLGPWEWIGKPYTVALPQEVEMKAKNSLEILANPLKDHYFKKFLENGPRSLLAESFLRGKLNIRQEMMVLESNHYPFITVLPLLLLFLLIWRKEFNIKVFLKTLINNPEIITIPIVFILILNLI